MEEREKAYMPQNYEKGVKWIIGAYEAAGVVFADGFQKDAIQNAVGAKKGKNWKNWKCDISYIKTKRGKFVVVEDWGTVGLTGKNIPIKEINRVKAGGEGLDPNERLSNFTSMFNSVDTSTGGGLYGVGKSVFSVASESCTYYFDSLREDGKYVANVNERGELLAVTLEGKEAKEYICEHTGFSEKTTVGTRIIIENPKKELVEAIKNGAIISFIQATWWRIIQRLRGEAQITVNGVRVSVPEEMMNTRYAYTLTNPEKLGAEYTVKNFGLYFFEDGRDHWSEISYYRRGMKIGEIEIKDIPKQLEGKYWGYVEVDEPWEELLANIEDKVHFGVARGKKGHQQYQCLKNFCATKLREQLIKWGFINTRENADKKLKDNLQNIANEIQDFCNKLGFENLGKGPQKPDFDVRWQNISYPVPDSEKVTSGDAICFSVRVKSSYAVDKRFEYRLSVVNPKTGLVISQIEHAKIKVKAKAVFSKDFIHNISSKNSERYAENRIVLSVRPIGSGKERKKELPYFFDIDKPDNSRDFVKLTLHECVFPNLGSRRVNFGESVKNVCYRIENNRNHALNFKLNISIHNASTPTCPKLTDIASLEGVVEPFGDMITRYIDEITFDRSIYEQHLTEGILELRARLIANEDDEILEKGDRITAYNYKIFLNCDEKHGAKDSFEPKSVDDPDNCKRSWYESGNGRSITINVGHPAYMSLSEEPEIQQAYIREQMLKQYVLLYLAEGKYEMFGAREDDFAELSPQDAIDLVLSKIENVYFTSLRWG